MDFILLGKAAIMGIVEGLTEFLPVSSTGHLILAGALLNFNDARGKLFELTRSGRALYRKVFEDAVERSQAWQSVLSADENAALMDMLDRLTEQARVLETAEKVNGGATDAPWGRASPSFSASSIPSFRQA